MAIRIVIAEDHTVLRNLLRDRLNKADDLEVVGEAENGLAAVALCGQLQPEVAILDITMPGMDGLDAIPLIREVSPDTRCVVLTMHQSQEKLREVLAVGGVGFLVKTASAETIVHAIRRVAAGHSFIELPVDSFDDLSDVVSEPPPRPSSAPGGTGQVVLTTHERELIRLVGLGHTNKEIAGELHLAVKTIEAHRAKLMQKLGLKKRVELVQYALRCGILQPAESF